MPSRRTDFINGRSGLTAVRAGLGASKRQSENARYRYSSFRDVPLYTDEAGGTASAADGGINLLKIGDVSYQVRLEQAITASPVFSTSNNGLLIDVDPTDNEGLELTLGRVQSDGSTVWTRSPGAFTIGTDEFYIRCQLRVGDVSASDQINVGFSVGAYPADGAVATYTDSFVLCVSLGDVLIFDRLNSGGLNTTDTTLDVADGGTVELEIRVDTSGNARAFVDGVAPPTDKTTFQFDTGDVVHAFYNQLNGAADDPEVTLIEWESGEWNARGLDSIDDLDDYQAIA